MTFFAIHRSGDASLATDRCFLSPSEWRACETAAQLLEQLRALQASQRAQLDTALSEVREAGFAAGRGEALRGTGVTLLAAWQVAADAARVDAQTLREAVVVLATQVVQRIADDLAPPDVVAALVQRASHELAPDQPAVVRVHPDVAAAVRQRAGGSTLDVRADPTLAPLDCVFDTPTGQLLAGLRTQLRHVTAALHADVTHHANLHDAP
ncbi:FliH/SctL family protein [Piscinibacter sp.]|uniref:FliH/SctL family protein n=1 Tax=Piscinibacter sp. TaxID=1903157 RepID=UPI002BE2CDD6|nr:FliH/SctL family protein [Albitalea sp.]HUG22603.1 FliH/SctL family protein [Albitalea sp.]